MENCPDDNMFFFQAKLKCDILEKIISPKTLTTIIAPNKRIIDPKELFIETKKSSPYIFFPGHVHQPVGNIPWGKYNQTAYFMDIEFAFYEIMLDAWEAIIRRKPDVGYIANLHPSGTLLLWIAQEHPKFLERLVKIIRGEVLTKNEKPHIELWISPFFESLTSTLTIESARYQVKLMYDIALRIGIKPSGYWLVERIWEPKFFTEFSKILRSEFDINIVAVDDHVFYKMNKGYTEKDLLGIYKLDESEVQNKPFYILPINKDLRSIRPNKMFDNNRKFSPKGFLEKTQNFPKGSVFIWGGDFEKILGNASKDISRRKEFKNYLIDETLYFINSEEFNFVSSYQLVHEVQSKGKVKLPHAGYTEIMLWAHDAEDYLKFEQYQNKIAKAAVSLSEKEIKEFAVLQQGVPWKNFWKKYPEGYHIIALHNYLYDKIKTIGDEKIREKALWYLGWTTTNCGHWHGVFGGRYLPNLRKGEFRGLIAAWIIYEEYKQNVPYIEETNLWKDYRTKLEDVGTKTPLYLMGDKQQGDVVLSTKDLTCIVNLEDGGSISDLFYKDPYRVHNLIDTIQLIKEPYHEKIPAAITRLTEKINTYIKLAQKSGIEVPENIYSIVHPELNDKLKALQKYTKPEGLSFHKDKEAYNLELAVHLKEYDTYQPTCDRIFILIVNKLIPIPYFTLTSYVIEDNTIKALFMGKIDEIEITKTYILKNSTVSISYQLNSLRQDASLIIEDNWGINVVDTKDFPKSIQVNKPFEIIDHDYDLRIVNSSSTNFFLEAVPRFSISQEIDYFIPALQQLRMRFTVPLKNVTTSFTRTIDICPSA